jgi:hypothetical protein
MLLQTHRTGLDPSGDAFVKGKEIFVSWPVNNRRPKDENGKLMSMGQNPFLPRALAPAIKGNRFTGV